MLHALGPMALAAVLSAAPVQSGASPGEPLAEREERLELFRDLVAAIRERHAFSEQTEKNLGRAWSDHLPGLEAEFAAASTPEALTAAVWHLQNSLHDRHCFFFAKDPGAWLTLGFEAQVEWVEDKPVFFVARIIDPGIAGAISPGDLLQELGGVPADRFLEAFELVSNANNPRGIAHDVAAHLGSRLGALSGAREGEAVPARFSSRATGASISTTLSWRRPPPPRPRTTSPNGPIDYDSAACANLPEPGYGPYSLQERGIRWCLYTSRQAPYDAHPIVRQLSFDYTSGPGPAAHLLRAERRWLELALAALPAARGVILDLRENTGGNDAAWFLDWWAPGPYANHFVDFVLYRDFERFRQANPAGFSGRDLGLYRGALESRAPGQRFWRHQPFFGRPEGCGPDQRCVPAHRVTSLPVALLVGPRCMSACDSFAQIFRENRFGPLVGEPPSAAYSLRAELPVTLPRSRRRIGVLHLAFSREQSGRTGEYLEGRLLELDQPLPRTFENRERYGQALVDAALRAFAADASSAEPEAAGEVDSSPR